jgi:hypothetical protein
MNGQVAASCLDADAGGSEVWTLANSLWHDSARVVQTTPCRSLVGPEEPGMPGSSLPDRTGSIANNHEAATSDRVKGMKNILAACHACQSSGW